MGTIGDWAPNGMTGQYQLYPKPKVVKSHPPTLKKLKM